MQNQCAEIKLRAERRAGEMLKANPDIRRGRKTDMMSGLNDYGLTEKQSSRWQLEAEVPEREFEVSFLSRKT